MVDEVFPVQEEENNFPVFERNLLLGFTIQPEAAGPVNLLLLFLTLWTEFCL